METSPEEPNERRGFERGDRLWRQPLPVILGKHLLVPACTAASLKLVGAFLLQGHLAISEDIFDHHDCSGGGGTHDIS